MTSISKLLGIAALGASLSLGATAATITAHYGDDDGFGIGTASGTIDPTVSNAGVGEAAGTDTRLIGTVGFIAPNFAPSGGFTFAVPSGSIIVGATLTMRIGSWTNNGTPVDGPGSDIIKLDGQDVDAAFLASFMANFGGEVNDIEEQTINLNPGFFADMADGSVSLAGSNLSEASGFGSFQVDFLRLDITTRETSDVPAPAPLGLLALGLGVLGVAKRRRA